MYTYKQFGNRYIVSVANRAEITAALTAFCTERGIGAGTITGIGAVDEAVLRFFDPATKEYVDRVFSEQMEISNLTGNIARKNGEPYIHLHVTLGRSDYSALVGHLLTAALNGAGEFAVEDFGGEAERYYDNELGLNLFRFYQS